jgi:hypothetical protein
MLISKNRFRNHSNGLLWHKNSHYKINFSLGSPHNLREHKCLKDPPNLIPVVHKVHESETTFSIFLLFSFFIEPSSVCSEHIIFFQLHFSFRPQAKKPKKKKADDDSGSDLEFDTADIGPARDRPGTLNNSFLSLLYFSIKFDLKYRNKAPPSVKGMKRIVCQYMCLVRRLDVKSISRFVLVTVRPTNVPIKWHCDPRKFRPYDNSTRQTSGATEFVDCAQALASLLWGVRLICQNEGLSLELSRDRCH